MQTATASGLHRRDAAFAAARQRRHDEYIIFKNAVLGTIQRSPVPVTANDLVTLLSQNGTKRNPTSVINALKDLQADGRIVSRRETHDEKLVRGGGVMPKAKAAKLFAAAPGPVPERTSLPEGVAPHRSLEHRLLEELGRRYENGTGYNRPKTVGRLAEHLGATKEEVRKTLLKLEKRGKVYQNASSWFITGKRARAGEGKRKRKPKTVAQITPTGTTVTVQGATDVQKETPAPTSREILLSQIVDGRTQDLVKLIGSAVGELANLAGTEDTDTVGVLTERVRHLEDENATLRAKLAQLRDALQG